MKSRPFSDVKKKLTNPKELDLVQLEQLRMAGHNLVPEVVEAVANLPVPIDGHQEVFLLAIFTKNRNFQRVWKHHFVLLFRFSFFQNTFISKFPNFFTFTHFSQTFCVLPGRLTIWD